MVNTAYFCITRDGALWGFSELKRRFKCFVSTNLIPVFSTAKLTQNGTAPLDLETNGNTVI